MSGRLGATFGAPVLGYGLKGAICMEFRDTPAIPEGVGIEGGIFEAYMRHRTLWPWVPGSLKGTKAYTHTPLKKPGTAKAVQGDTVYDGHTSYIPKR